MVHFLLNKINLKLQCYAMTCRPSSCAPPQKNRPHNGPMWVSNGLVNLGYVSLIIEHIRCNREHECTTY